jgi:hypothetical protein
VLDDLLVWQYLLQPCCISRMSLESVESLVGHLTTQWSHGTTFAEGSCIRGDVRPPVGAECYLRDVPVPHEISDMWQFCRTIGKGNHNNTSYNILCCGVPPKFHDHLQKLAMFTGATIPTAQSVSLLSCHLTQMHPGGQIYQVTGSSPQNVSFLHITITQLLLQLCNQPHCPR